MSHIIRCEEPQMRAIPLNSFTSLAVLGLLVTGCGQGLLGGGESDAQSAAAGANKLVTEGVEGMAYRTGDHRFALDPRGPVSTGFTLR
jgi:hypothetical protein